MQWLLTLGADVAGLSLKPLSSPSHFSLLGLDKNFEESDICCYDTLYHALNEHQPEIIFHLAAQAIVSHSYSDPLSTFNTNILGTANLLNTCREQSSVRAVIIVTTDKCYENKEWTWPYRENDSLGGHDPYSSSKACAEIISNSMRLSFFNPLNYPKEHKVLIASARSGRPLFTSHSAVAFFCSRAARRS